MVPLFTQPVMKILFKASPETPPAEPLVAFISAEFTIFSYLSGPDSGFLLAVIFPAKPPLLVSEVILPETETDEAQHPSFT